MIPFPVTPDQSIADILSYCPAAAQIFLKHRMDCVGCQLNAFETIADATRVYGISLNAFLAELNHVLHPEESPDGVKPLP
jgi:hybrid cluster-associated redox disulfide protein